MRIGSCDHQHTKRATEADMVITLIPHVVGRGRQWRWKTRFFWKILRSRVPYLKSWQQMWSSKVSRSRYGRPRHSCKEFILIRVPYRYHGTNLTFSALCREGQLRFKNNSWFSMHGRWYTFSENFSPIGCDAPKFSLSVTFTGLIVLVMLEVSQL